ncbi:hypothetical protein BDV37DRAFT_277351 [Aspergillus pseudonomiae]|uniref:Uncharacterized protein n=1 Tax=Aspergillus pseudonomiae TaxID=1506151 RepID=A0A5N7CSC9_9EURO|nr:uncharacterized protein BDV37DRAFT_277351 [Aspergillus pseudonomiae]KAE8396839.1 hypothetical protein BDV37DRAFT_277351 [Aspergillus pseudonomiae]
MQSGILAFIHFAVLILKFFPGVTRCIRHRHFSALTFTLVEFQEAQCFYMLSFQFAALTALVAGPQLYEATSLAQLTSNTSTVKAVALMGVLPITHGLWILHRVDLHSWYISLWSAITIVVSSVTLHLCKMEPRVANLQSIATASHLDKCGYHPPPLIYCRSHSDYYFSAMTLIFFGVTDDILNFVCIGIYGILALQRLALYPKRWLNRKPSFQATYHRAYPWLVSKRARFVSRTLTAIIEIILLSSNFFYIFGIVALSLPTIAFSSWSFGQIIAVAIWAPLISKYLYWCFFGSNSYSAIRFPYPYRISRAQAINNEHHPN